MYGPKRHAPQMPKRTRDEPAAGLQVRIAAILNEADDEPSMKLCTASLEWDKGTVKEDYFTVLRPFVETLAQSSMEAQLFFESESKDDATVLEEARFLVRSSVIGEEDEVALKAAAPADRKRMLFIHLLIDADDEELVEGEEGEEGEESGEESDAE